MYLTVKIVNGERAGISFQVRKFEESNDLKITENESLSFEFFDSSDEISAVSLSFEDIELNFVEIRSKGVTKFVLEPKRKGHFFVPLFQNYFGMAFPELKIEYVDGRYEKIRLQTIDVLASKLTAESAQDMLEYVLENSDNKLLKQVCPTSKEVSFVEGGEEPQKILDKIDSTVKKIEPLLFQIISKPISKLSYSTEMINGELLDDIGEDGYSWVLENLSVIDQAEDIEHFHFNYEGKPYKAQEILTDKISENPDVYENRMIYGFLIKLKKFLVELEIKCSSKKTTVPTTKISEKYISLFDIINKSNTGYFGISETRILGLKVKLNYILDNFKYETKITREETGFPLITEKVKNNKSYMSVFKIIHEWYRFNKIDWSKSDLFLSIKNIPTLFEIYCVLSIKYSLEKHLDKIYESQGSEIIIGELNGSRIALKYEPDYWGANHINSNGQSYISTQIKSYKYTKSITNNHRYNKRTPDFVIELGEHGSQSIIVLDAKYSSLKVSFEERLPECIVKYVHSIYASNGGVSPVSSMVLISPNHEYKFIDMHLSPYGLMDSKTVFPITGVQGIKVTKNSEEQFEKITLKLIEKNKEKPSYELYD